jgi:hypothetical protein
MMSDEVFDRKKMRGGGRASEKCARYDDFSRDSVTNRRSTMTLLGVPNFSTGTAAKPAPATADTGVNMSLGKLIEKLCFRHQIE